MNAVPKAVVFDWDFLPYSLSLYIPPLPTSLN